MKIKEPVKGYKIIPFDWTCINVPTLHVDNIMLMPIMHSIKYSCPGEFKEDVVPSLCHRGMHFCKELKDCYSYCPAAILDYDPDFSCKEERRHHVVEVEAIGDICEGGNKMCTNHLRIIRELAPSEIKDILLEELCFTYEPEPGKYLMDIAPPLRYLILDIGMLEEREKENAAHS